MAKVIKLPALAKEVYASALRVAKAGYKEEFVEDIVFWVDFDPAGYPDCGSASDRADGAYCIRIQNIKDAIVLTMTYCSDEGDFISAAILDLPYCTAQETKDKVSHWIKKSTMEMPSADANFVLRRGAVVVDDIPVEVVIHKEYYPEPD